jgi:hypothetical protein
MNNPVTKIDHIEKLPIEVLDYIFAHLPKESLLTCKLVCKVWCRLANENPMLKSRMEQKPDFLATWRQWENLMAKENFIQAIETSDRGEAVPKLCHSFCTDSQGTLYQLHEDGHISFRDLYSERLEKSLCHYPQAFSITVGPKYLQVTSATFTTVLDKRTGNVEFTISHDILSMMASDENYLVAKDFQDVFTVFAAETGKPLCTRVNLKAKLGIDPSDSIVDFRCWQGFLVAKLASLRLLVGRLDRLSEEAQMIEEVQDLAGPLIQGRESLCLLGKRGVYLLENNNDDISLKHVLAVDLDAECTQPLDRWSSDKAWGVVECLRQQEMGPCAFSNCVLTESLCLIKKVEKFEEIDLTRKLPSEINDSAQQSAKKLYRVIFCIAGIALGIFIIRYVFPKFGYLQQQIRYLKG